MTTTRMLDVFGACLDQIRDEGVERVVYKCVPHIYHSQPAEEDAYALFVNDAQLVPARRVLGDRHAPATRVAES